MTSKCRNCKSLEKKVRKMRSEISKLVAFTNVQSKGKEGLRESLVRWKMLSKKHAKALREIHNVIEKDNTDEQKIENIQKILVRL